MELFERFISFVSISQVINTFSKSTPNQQECVCVGSAFATACGLRARCLRVG
jgi:hypothetical protein